MGKQNQNLANQYEVLRIVAEQNQEFIMEYEASTDTMQVYKVENGEFVTVYDLWTLQIKICVGRR